MWDVIKRIVKKYRLAEKLLIPLLAETFIQLIERLF